MQSVCNMCCPKRLPSEYCNIIRTGEPLELMTMDLWLQACISLSRSLFQVHSGDPYPRSDGHYNCPTTLYSCNLLISLPSQTVIRPEFVSQLIQKLCALLGIQESQTSPYHPQDNGVCKRLSRTLLGMIHILEKEHQE